jgi:hypothetical protein
MCRLCNETEPTLTKILLLFLSQVAVVLHILKKLAIDFLIILSILFLKQLMWMPYLVRYNIHYDYSCSHGLKGDRLLCYNWTNIKVIETSVNVVSA